MPLAHGLPRILDPAGEMTGASASEMAQGAAEGCSPPRTLKIVDAEAQCMACLFSGSRVDVVGLCREKIPRAMVGRLPLPATLWAGRQIGIRKVQPWNIPMKKMI